MKTFLGSHRLGPALARAAAVVLAATVVALALSGLSGCSSGGGNGSATGLLRQTFSGGSIHSGKLALDLALNLQGVQSLPGPIDFKLNGPFQGGGGSGQIPKFNMLLTVAGSGQSLSAGLASTGTKGYLLFQGNPYSLSDAQFSSFRQQYLQAQAKARANKSSTLASLGVDPTRWLINPTKAGTQNVGGAQTIHITAGIDVGRFLADVNTLLSKASRLGAGSVATLPTSLNSRQRAAVARSVKSATVDVYTGSADKILRRLDFSLNIAVPADLRTAANGLKGGTISFDLLLSDVNSPQTIPAPSNARPLSDLLSAVGAAGSSGTPRSGSSRTPRSGAAPAAPSTGSGSGTSGSGGAGTSGAGTSGSGASQAAYLACLQRAGQDIRAIQKCGTLLHG
ncbi:MAG TPA: hypothetical protein VGY97_01125 [Solirubrobacteraceae bacterium]|nr:hypothetical protein [Solirubrobacteraceae bacterium]